MREKIIKIDWVTKLASTKINNLNYINAAEISIKVINL